MGSFSGFHWVIVLLVILILFGAGKLPKVAGDLAAGIKNFKKGMQDKPEDAPVQPASQPRTLEGEAVNASVAKDKATHG